jgi:REP-associated tyrosine transposase
VIWSAPAERSGDGALGLRLMTTPQRISWPHAPLHQLSANGTYIVTAGTYRKAHHFSQPNRLNVLQRGLLSVAEEFGWSVEAWAIFSNHYHFVAHSPEAGADNLARMLGFLHEKTAKWINDRDDTAGREVWHNFWETKLTPRNSYLARLHYVHQNPVRHGLVYLANQYPWVLSRLVRTYGATSAGQDDIWF